MDAIRKQFCQVVEDERGLVRYNGLGHVLLVPTPKRESDQFVVLARRDGRQTVKTMLDTLEISCCFVVIEVPVAVTCLDGLLCGEVATLLVGKGG